MKLFLRIIAIASFIFFFTQEVDAQKAYRKTFYGDFFGGMTLATMDIEGNNAYKNLKVGFQVGTNFKYRFAYNIELQSGIYLIKKGLSQDEKLDKPIGDTGINEIKDIKHTIDANYIQVPLNLGFEIPLVSSKSIYLSAHAGLYAAYGFKGDTKIKGYEARRPAALEDGSRGPMTDIVNINTVEKTFSDFNLKKWDYGFNANAALIFDMFVFQFQYDHGWANIATSNKSSGAWKTRNYSLSLGFRF